MRRFVLPLVMLAALLAPQPAFAGQPPVGVVTNFGPNLAAVCHMPEGIAIDPTSGISTVCFAADSPGHSWQNVAAIGSPLGHKGMLVAAKAGNLSPIVCLNKIDLAAPGKDGSPPKDLVEANAVLDHYTTLDIQVLRTSVATYASRSCERSAGRSRRSARPGTRRCS